jgi:hypothetical protein
MERIASFFRMEKQSEEEQGYSAICLPSRLTLQHVLPKRQ